MATKLFLRVSLDNGLGALRFDMLTTAGASMTTSTTLTVASGTEIQCTNISGGSVLEWVSGRVPSGGFTLTTTDISIWGRETAIACNCALRYRLFKFTAPSTIVELAGGPFDNTAELGLAQSERTWAGNPTDTAFAEDNRLILRLYIYPAPTLTMGQPGTDTVIVQVNAADTVQGDSWLNLAETVAFKAEDPAGWGPLLGRSRNRLVRAS